MHTLADGSMHWLKNERRGLYYAIEEDERGTLYSLIPRDLCMIEHIPELVQ